MKSILLISIFMILVACAPSAQLIPTAVAPTQVVLPTSTVVPTVTTNLTSTPNNQAYINALESRFTIWVAAYTAFYESFQELRADTNLLSDSNWISSMDNTMNTLTDAADELESITPVPPDFETMNGLLIQMASETRLLVLSFKLFLGGDSTQVEEVIEHNNKLSEYLQLTTDEIENYTP